MKTLYQVILVVFFVLAGGFNPASGQNAFKVVGAIPHLPVIDPATVTTPQTGMLVFSSSDSKPMIYTGFSWESLCTTNISALTAQDYFVVKEGIPFLPVFGAAPTGLLLSGTVYYSTTANAVMVYNGSTWTKMVDMPGGVFSLNASFASGLDVKTIKLPVLNADPSVPGLSAGAFYINAGTKAIRYYTGSFWLDVSCQAVVRTLPLTDVGGYTAMSGGEVISNGSSPVTLTGICWSETADPDTTLTTKTRIVTTGSGIGVFTSQLTGLLPKHTYHVRAYAVNGLGLVYGEDRTFTTPIVPPTIITLPVSKETSISAESGGDIPADGGSPVTHRGIIWSSVTDPLNDQSHIVTDDGSGVGYFPSTLDWLLGNTTYYIRAYAVNVAGTAYGNLVVFTTPPPVPPTLVFVVKTTGTTGNSANLTSTIMSNGGALVTERGICYREAGSATWYYVPSTTITPTDIGTYVSKLTGLSQGTTYYVRGYGVNIAGIGYSPETSFITPSLTRIITQKPTATGGFTAKSGGNLYNTGYTVISARGICWDVTRNPTVALTTKTSDGVTGDGTGIYNSYLTGLTPGLTYYVRAYAINSAGVAYGNLDSLVTATKAFITTDSPTNVTNVQAVVGGVITDDGREHVTARGVCWSLTPNPTTARADSMKSMGSDIGAFSDTIYNLLGSTKYYVRAYAINSVGTAYGRLDSLITSPPGLAQVLTTNIAITSGTTATTGAKAIAMGTVKNNGGALVTDRGFCWNTTGTPTITDLNISSGNGNGAFSGNMEDLVENLTYYVRAYAVNSIGIAYGNQDSITVPAAGFPAVSTTDVINIAAITATLRGNVASDGGDAIRERGFCWNTTGGPVIGDAGVSVSISNLGGGTGGFLSDLTGLIPHTDYYFRAYAINAKGTSYGHEIHFSTLELPTVTTIVPSSITNGGAVSGGNISSNGGLPITGSGVCWSTTNPPTITDDLLESGSSGIFLSNITGLTGNTTYYVCAYAKNRLGISYGAVETFTTLPPDLAIVETTVPVAISSVIAVGGGEIVNNGGSPVTTYGIYWSTTPNFTPTISDFHTVHSGSYIGNYADSIKSLLPSTFYYVKAYVVNSAGTSYGAEISFQTPALPPPVVLPVLTTATAFASGATSAVSGGNITSDGGGNITSRGIVWSTVAGFNPDIVTVNRLYAGSGTGSFISKPVGLIANTTYYIRALATNSAGTAYGDELSFTTFSIPTVTTKPVSDITSVSGQSGGDILSDGGIPVTSSGICWNTTGNPIISDPNTFSGIGIGEFIHSMRKLLGGTTYYVRAYAVNDAGIAYGNEQSFSTLPSEKPIVLTTIAGSGVTGKTGFCGGAISSNGGALITTEGIIWSTVSGFSPDINSTNKTVGSGTGDFTTSFGPLACGTTYYVRAYATNSAGVGYASNEVSFTTFDVPILTTIVPYSITNVTANTGGDILSTGGPVITGSGVCYSINNPPTIADECLEAGVSAGLYIKTLTELMGSTTYYVRAYAKNSIGIGYGQVESFTTQAPVLATILTTLPTATSSVTASAGGRIVSHGGSVVTTRGIYWSTIPGFVPINAVPHTAQTGYFTGVFIDNMTDLLPNTIYYVRAYVVNSAGTAYGAEMSFKTPTIPVLSTKTISSNGPTKASGGGDIIDDGGAAITAKGIVWSTIASFNPDTVVVNRTNNGAGTGSFVSLLAGLKGNAIYYVQAYATNVAGTGYGNLLSFITDPPKLATLSTANATSISGTAAVVGGSISDNGGEPILSRGLVWSTFQGFRPDTVIYNKTLSGAMGLGAFSENMSGLIYGTTYYVRAYATNSIGIAFGNEISFTTINLPTLTTLAVSPALTGKSAKGGGLVVTDGGSLLINQGVCWSTSPNPTVGLYTRTSSDRVSNDSIHSTLLNLTPGTIYYVRAYAVNNEGLSYGDEVSFTTPPALPVLTTNYANITSPTTVTTGGTITTDNGAVIIQRGVVWSTDIKFNPDTVIVNRSLDGVGSGVFESVISNMELRKFYYIRAYATNSVGTSYGNQVTATLFPTAPVLNTIEPNVITGSNAMSGGEIVSDGGAAVVLKGICWSKKTNPTTDNSHTYNGVGNDPYTAMLTGLAPNTLYYVRSYAINKIGTAYGVEKTILTNNVPTLAATTPATNIVATTATSGGEITDDGRSPILSRGVCWSTYPNPDISLSTKTVDTSSPYIGSFVANMKGLTPTKTYYVRAYATNAVGTGYGSMMQFTTLAVVLPTLTTLRPSAIDSIKATCGGDITDDGGMPITDRGICWNTSRDFTTVGSPKAFNHIRNAIGVYTDSLTALAPGTKYYVKAFAINSKGTAYGNLDSLTTIAILPKVSNVTMSNLLQTTGDATATVFSDGGAPVTERGFCWNTTGMPTTANDTLSMGTGIGKFIRTIEGLGEQLTYYVRAFATNSSGTAYSPVVTSFRLCPSSFDVLHIEGLNGAPVTRKITYHSVSSSISGKASCWLTQNLGAVQEAPAATNGVDSISGWYWQFNRIQGYQYSASRTPNLWVANINENSNWISDNDPCNKLLGTGWRIPTNTEWTNADGLPQNWTSYAKTFASDIKLHAAGYLVSGGITGRGNTGEYWASTQSGNTTAYHLAFNGSICEMQSHSKSTYAFALRCLRDTVILSTPSVSNVEISNMTSSTVDVSAAVSPDGGSAVTDRGFCWNTNGIPTLSDNLIPMGTGLGSFTNALIGLQEQPTYYVRAYATNNQGTVYSPVVTRFKMCVPEFTVEHIGNLNGAPVSKTVTYHSVSSTLSGKSACWLTQNLGADSIAKSIVDATEKAAGWYWQFNRLQGYKHDGISRTPASGWVATISENSDWLPENDPCNRLIGSGWRIPTFTEWGNVITNGNLATSSAYNSELKLHTSGLLSGGALQYRSMYGYQWSSTQSAATTGNSIYLYNTAGVFPYTGHGKATYAFSLRCIRDTLVISKPSVSKVDFSSFTQTSVDVSAAVTPDGGASITDRGFYWNTTGNPTDADNVISNGSGTGVFISTINGLTEGPTYYVKAYATNSIGTTYSDEINSFRICPLTFDVMHVEGLNGAPASKTVTYHSVSSTLSGKANCWLTQNLGADNQAASVTDGTDASAGWYWQFNRTQAYKYAGTTRTPLPWVSSISENSNWIQDNDPCNLLLSGGWRIPTETEWTNADGASHNWTTYNNAYNSELKLHNAGCLAYNTGVLAGRGTQGNYWSNSAAALTLASDLQFTSSTSTVMGHNKAYGFSLRCLRDTIVIAKPSVSTITFSGMTQTSVDITAAATPDGGAPINDRGFCWNTTGAPDITENPIQNGAGTGSFTSTISGLAKGTYYVRAYAINSAGITYGQVVSLFIGCPSPFSVLHIEGFNGAPLTKTVNYSSISTNISGRTACWLTQNLGADNQAASLVDATEPAAGWYWQFNRVQGYQYTTTRTPASTWIAAISESSDWTPANDPCNLLLGGGWRIPTGAEWTAADAAPQNWTTGAKAFASELKLHNAGYLSTTAVMTARAIAASTQGNYWGSTSIALTTANSLQFTATTSAMVTNNKAAGYPLRCLRESIVVTTPSVSNVSLSAMTSTSVDVTAAVTPDGGATVTDRGFCWNSTGNPMVGDNTISTGNGLGIFTGTIPGLKEGPAYYVRAYAINSAGITYSAVDNRIIICTPEFTVDHIAGFNGAPVTKTVTYHSINSSLAGKPSCWLTQNLGADYQAGVVGDGTEAAAGWYWQFNRSQGYQHTTTTRTPNNVWEPWVGAISESKDWEAGNDPCNLLLGLGWRLPTATEWTTVDAAPQNWATGAAAFNSELKLHYGGMLIYNTGAIANRGTYGYWWSSTQFNATVGSHFFTYSNFSNLSNTYSKAYAMPVRCLRDQLTLSIPSVSDVTISNLTDDTADGSAVVTKDGGDAVTERGLCWNTTGLPTITDHLLPMGSDKGAFTTTLTGLEEGPTYYVRAYATNSQGAGYSENVSSFKICKSFTAIHQAGLNGAPVSKTITYHPVNTNISGTSLCWLTQNLGADNQASAVGDATEVSAGWYWQFNRSQGYQYTTIRTPNDVWNPWVASISESKNWETANDPCNLLLGSSWRLPTATEWTNADAPPQNWTTGVNAFNSELKLHYAGLLNYPDGVIANRGTYGYWWTSTQFNLTVGFHFFTYSNFSNISSTYSKACAMPVRCVRDQLIVSLPSVSDVTISNLMDDSADGSAVVSQDGGAAVTDRGLCWNTTGSPTTADNVIPAGSDRGAFTAALTGLTENFTYYVRAYATNSQGIAYSDTVSSFKICHAFTAIHEAGANGAPVSKTVTYHPVSSNISKASLCWLTQNLGADQQATVVTDATEASAGWYWQFNRSQGYQYTTTRTPNDVWNPWIASISESKDWEIANDPCNLLLGGGWRLPTATEWTNADAPPQNWTTGANAFSSELKLHYGGVLSNANGTIANRGTYGYWWTSTQLNLTVGSHLFTYSNFSNLSSTYSKAYAMPVRCVRDQLVLSLPSVSDVTISNLTDDSADGSAVVSKDGGDKVTDRGLCWNTTGTPTMADNVIQVGSDMGTFSTTLTGLVEGPTYYVRAYAVNNQGVAYSSEVSSFKICHAFTVIHEAGLNGSPVDKTVSYHPISTNISGAALCWLTQNLGADNQATSLTDATEASAGWYWQFNRSQGYQYTTTRTPANAWTPWITSISEAKDWETANDPCNLLLGGGWRLPTATEWTNADAPPQNWTTGVAAFNSELKLHYAGVLANTNGSIANRGTYGYWWSSTQFNATVGSHFFTYSNFSNLSNTYSKAYAMPVRCVRNLLAVSVPSVSNVVISNLTDATADGSAVVTKDDAQAINERGLCWNTTGNPTVTDNTLPTGSDSGEFLATLLGLMEGPTYYVRAYAKYGTAVSYSPKVSSFKICRAFTAIHQAGLNGAPVSKTVTYRPVSSNISKASLCWLTQNLGADNQAGSVTDATEASAGWYWQFNRSQGYQYTTALTPTNAWTPWITSISESKDWEITNDPCNLLLGSSWRLPTATEWTNADAPPQNWTTGANAFNSELKLHYGGVLSNANGTIANRGTYGYWWTSTQLNLTVGSHLFTYSNFSNLSSTYSKAYAMPVRCVRDQLVVSLPSVSNVTISSLTDDTATGSAVVALDGGETVNDRGLCWNTSGLPTIADNTIREGSDPGAFASILTGLVEGPTYYVRAYATNDQGTGYSQDDSSFKICHAFTAVHDAGVNGAPVSKMVTYHPISTNVSGVAQCWLTQNLGADQQAGAVNDNSEASAGWYWQFNRSQGYQHDGVTRTPATSWIGSISESANWAAGNDPCNLLLGSGWRLPTSTEWTNADAPPQNWLTGANAFSSELKLHYGGVLSNANGIIANRGTYGYWWTSTQLNLTVGSHLFTYSNFSNLSSTYSKAYAMPVRCLKD